MATVNPQQAKQEWMPKVDEVHGMPPGLQYLTQVDQLLVHQQVELLEAITGWETSNKYAVKNSLGQQVYFAAEESGMCMRQCCGPNRGFVLHITDNNSQEVIRIVRDFKCCAGCCWCASSNCCAMELTIECPPGNPVGTVKQQGSFLKPRYATYDTQGEMMFRIEGPTCICQAVCCTGDVDFNITTPDYQHQIGKISKQWAGFVKEWLTQADNFGITFPMDLDVKVKATLMGALFLIDFMHFEENKKNNNS